MTEERFECVAEVTQDRINRGVRCDPECCPIALALQEQMPDATDIDVSAFGISLIRNRKHYKSKTSEEAFAFINSFDHNGHPDPTSIPLTFWRVMGYEE